MSESEWPVPQRPMGLGTIYLSSLRLAARSIRGLAVALVVLVPLYALFGSVARSFLLEAAAIFERQGALAAEATPELLAAAFGQIAGAGSLLFLLVLVIVVATTVVQLAMTSDAWDRAVGIERGTGAWIASVAGRPLATTAVQLVIVLVLTSMFGIAIVIATAVFAGVAGEAGGDLIFVGSSLVLVFLVVATAFRLHEIVADARGPWRSLVSSAALVRRRWWKVFLAMMPLFALSMVLSEIVARLVPGHAIDPSVVESDATTIGAMAIAYREIGQFFSPVRAASLGVVSALTQFALVILLTVLYVDLRARRGDFDYEEEAGGE